MASVFLVAAAVTVVPALGMLFYLLRRYEGYFEDARVFFSLVVGFFAGLVLAFLENVLFQFDSPEFAVAAGLAFAFSYYVAGYAVLESGALSVILGAGKFRGRKDTPYYGAALGIGFGMMIALQGVALGFQRGALLEQGLRADVVAVVLVIVALAAGGIMAHAATGVWVGRGSAEGKLWGGLGRGALVQMPVLVCLWFTRNVPSLEYAFAWTASLAVFVLGYGFGILTYTQRTVLDTIVPPEIRDQVLKERRRGQRKEMR